MAQKASPYAIRVGYNQTWNSYYFSEGKKDQINWLEKDKLIRDYFSLVLPNIVRLVVNYSTNNILVYLYIPEVNLILGENNEKLNKIIKGVYKIINDDKVAVKINLIEIKKVYTHAQSVANLIAEQLKKRLFSGMVLRNTLSKISFEKSEVKGVKIQIKGRLDGSDIGNKKKDSWGRMPLSEIDSNVELKQKIAVMSYGVIGIKVWIYRGKIWQKRNKNYVNT